MRSYLGQLYTSFHVLALFKQSCSSGNEEKLAVCKDLGADVCINYKTEDFVARVKEETGGKGELS